MLQYHTNEALSSIHRQELEQEAAKAALAANVEPSKKSPFYAPALAQLGNTLIDLGNDLQERYGELCEMEAARKPQPATTR